MIFSHRMRGWGIPTHAAGPLAEGRGYIHILEQKIKSNVEKAQFNRACRLSGRPE